MNNTLETSSPTRPNLKNAFDRKFGLPTWIPTLAIGIAIFAALSILILRAEPDLNFTFRFSFAPLLAAPVAIQIHVLGALGAFFLGLWILNAPKVGTMHKPLGWVWIVFMLVTAVSSFFIFGLMGRNPSPIHALSAWTIIGLPMGVAAIRRKDVTKHRKHMTGIFIGGMAIAGLFTFLPGRLMWSLFFVT